MKKNIRNALALCLAVLMMATMLAGCSGGASSSTPASASASAASGTSSNDSTTLTLAINADILTTDPQALNNGTTTSVLYNVFSNLVKYDDAGEIVMDLAESYELLEDQVTWEFKIREDAVFHDGTPVTAEDVAWSLTRVMTDESSSDYMNFSPLAEAVAVDDYTVHVVSKDPYPIMLQLLCKGGAAVLPKAYFEENGEEAWLANPIGSGPYQLTEYVKDDHVTLVPFADYYGEQNPD